MCVLAAHQKLAILKISGRKYARNPAYDSYCNIRPRPKTGLGLLKTTLHVDVCHYVGIISENYPCEVEWIARSASDWGSVSKYSRAVTKRCGAFVAWGKLRGSPYWG